MSSQGHTQSYSRRAGFSSFNLKYLLLFCFTVSSTEGLTVTCAAALTYHIGTEDLITLSCIYTKIVHCVAAIIHAYSHNVKKSMGFGFYTLFF